MFGGLVSEFCSLPGIWFELDGSAEVESCEVWLCDESSCG